jgi:hypothetical protein
MCSSGLLATEGVSYELEGSFQLGVLGLEINDSLLEAGADRRELEVADESVIAQRNVVAAQLHERKLEIRV